MNKKNPTTHQPTGQVNGGGGGGERKRDAHAEDRTRSE